MIAVLEAPPAGSGPDDLIRARRRSRDAWLAEGGDAVLVVEADDPRAAGADARLVLHEPEALVVPGALEHAARALAAGASRVEPAGFYAGAAPAPRLYVTVWELERLAADARAAGSPPTGVEAGPSAAPVELRRTTGNEGPARRLPGWLVHSFAGRRSFARPEVLPLVPAHARSVLELGCAEGALGAELEARGARVTGIEPDPACADVAARRLSRVLPVPLEQALPVLGETYDAIVACDVLEHLEDPIAALLALRPHLAPGGCLVFSLPNATHASVLAGALMGRWDPALEGIVADDHRTYAGRRGWDRVLRAGGFGAAFWQPVSQPASGLSPWTEILVRDSLQEADVSTLQWLGVAHAVEGAPPALDLGPSAGAEALDAIDPIAQVRRELERADRAAHVLPNAVSAAVLEPLLRGDVAAGAARAALAGAFTEHGLAARFARSGILVDVERRGPAALSPDLARLIGEARTAGLLREDDVDRLGATALRATFRRHTGGGA